MRKTITLLFIITLIFTTVACSSSREDTKKSNKPTNTTSEKENEEDSSLENQEEQIVSENVQEEVNSSDNSIQQNNSSPKETIDETPKCSHSYTSATCTEASICTKCGITGTGALGHSWRGATCTEANSCARCGITDGEALGHNNSGGSCSRCGTTMSIDMKTKIGSPNDCETTSSLGGFSFNVNSANGIKVLWGGENLSGKTINYYTITFYFYNAVGDPAYSEITGQSSKTKKWVGPVEPNGTLICFDIVDYVSACDKVTIGEIKLEYADGTTDYGWYGWETTYENPWID